MCCVRIFCFVYLTRLSKNFSLKGFFSAHFFCLVVIIIILLLFLFCLLMQDLLRLNGLTKRCFVRIAKNKKQNKKRRTKLEVIPKRVSCLLWWRRIENKENGKKISLSKMTRMCSGARIKKKWKTNGNKDFVVIFFGSFCNVRLQQGKVCRQIME